MYLNVICQLIFLMVSYMSKNRLYALLTSYGIPNICDFAYIPSIHKCLS